MLRPPDPEMRRATLPGGPVSHEDRLSTTEPNAAIIELQAGKLRRLYFFCHAIAVTVARLAYGVAR